LAVRVSYGFINLHCECAQIALFVGMKLSENF